MASHKLMETKDGKKFYKISVSRGYGLTPYTMRWYVPEGWSKRAIESKLKSVEGEFETRCSNGEVLTRSEQKEIEEQARIEASKVQTFKEFTEKVFMPELIVTCSEHTRSSFQGMLKNHIYPVLGNIAIPEITAYQISAFLLSLQSEKHLAHASVIKVYTIINLVLKRAFKGKASLNPMLDVDRPKPTKSEGKKAVTISEDEIYSKSEIEYILKCMEAESLQWRTMINLLIYTGIRRGEACGLKWRCVNFDSNTIRIENNLIYTPETGIMDDTPKNGKARIIPVNPAAMALLKQLHDKQSEGKIIPQYVFIQEGTASPMHPDSPTRFCKKMEKKYGIEGFHPHKLRHSFVSNALMDGADIVSVSEYVGHSDVAVTERVYAHSNKAGLERVSNLVYQKPTTEKKAEQA